jgi:hypothetical protein
LLKGPNGESSPCKIHKEKSETTEKLQNKREQDEYDAATNGAPVLEWGTVKGAKERLPKSRPVKRPHISRD